MDDRYKANGTRLSRLVIDKGTEAMRNVFDSIHPPATLTTTLNANYGSLRGLRVINRSQMDILFPPAPLVSTSENYDITLLYILFRNICHLRPPASTGGSWDRLPPPNDRSKVADLARIKYYKNRIYSHITTTGVTDVNFQSYWNDISAALIRLRVNVDEIEDLKTGPLEVGSQKKIKIFASVLLFTIFVTAMYLGLFYNSPKEVQNSFALNFSSHVNNSNSDFVGRKWFFQELEHAVNNSRTQSGVIILGDPGSGKSAIMLQLISSPSSSPFIHKNIIGYHLCKFDEKRTRNGMRFVHTLVQQLARNIPEYSIAIKKPEIQNELNIHCKDDPIGCFHTTILDPIRELKGQQNTNKYILIDALDECIEKDEKSSEIITILKNKMVDFPIWINLIISSRNKISLIAKLTTFEKLAISSKDQRNLEDIRSYVEETTVLKNLLGNDVKSWISEHLNIVNGVNFLYVKTLLQYGVYNQSRYFFPPTLDRLYGSLFRDRFEKEDFDSFAPLFEVLLASNSPPTMTKLEAILKIREDTYNARRVVKHVSEYLIIGSDETVRFYHQSFANWLMKQTENSDGLFIKKSKGYQYIVDYLFDYFHKKHTLDELTELSMLFGVMEERHVSKLKDLNVSEIRDPKNGECILHKLAKERKSTPIIKIFLNNFDSIDILTKYDKLTPLCYAASSGNFDNLKLFIDYGAAVNNVFNSNQKTMLTIASNGYTEIAELLIRNGVDFGKKKQFTREPLWEAALNGRLDFVKFLVNEGVNDDVSALHCAATKNYSDVVRFLLDSGIRDVCGLACEPGDLQYSCETLKYTSPYHSTNSCFCETALYAAVSRGHMIVVKLLLSYGKASLECKYLSGKTPLLHAAERNDTEMATLLLNKGANVEAECETLINIYEYSKFYTENCNEVVCSCGTRSIHLFAKQRSWEIVKELVSRWNANPFSENCQGLTLVIFAIMQDRVDIIRNFNATYAGEITKFIMNKTALRYTAVCGSTKTLKWLSTIANSSFFQTVYDNGMTLLHLAANWSNYPVIYDGFSWKIQSCTEDIQRSRWYFNKTHFSLQNVYEYKKRLITVRLLTKLQQKINKTDKYGRTALHYAAERGFAGAVRHLVRQGSDWKIKDRSGDTPLELALRESPSHPRDFLPCRMTSDGVFKSCNSTMFDETVSYLIMVQKSSIKKCNTGTKRFLRTLVKKNMPLSLYNLFKIGVDVNCGIALRKQLNISKVKNDEISEVFKIFEVNVNVECDVPFSRSELHLMAYLGTPSDIGNFFKPCVNNRSFPFQRLINNHRKGFRVLDECRDEEGYLVIHRAAVGGNVDAVSWFISLGVDIFKKTRSGWNALDLSIKYLLPEQIFLQITHFEDPALLHPNQPFIKLQNLRKRTFEKLLEQFLKTINYKGSASFSWCKPEFTALSPLHIAASWGMEILNYVHKKAGILPISCTNKHGVVPLYLAYLYESVKWISFSEHVLDRVSLDHPYEGRYPEREAEYHLLYNHIFQTPQVDLSFELDFEGLFECPGMNEILKREKIEGQIEQCNNHCWKSTSQVIRIFLSAFPYIVIGNVSFGPFGKGFIHTVSQMSELRYHTVKMFYKIPSRFWRQVSEAYFCSYRCRCVEIMRLLQEQFTSQPRRYKRAGKFVAERMGWKDTSTDNDRWPFRFLLKKALRKDKAYEYLKIIGEDFNILLEDHSERFIMF